MSPKKSNRDIGRKIGHLALETILWHGDIIRDGWQRARAIGTLAFIVTTLFWSGIWIALSTPTVVGVLIGAATVSMTILLSIRSDPQQTQQPQQSQQTQRPQQSQQADQEEYVKDPPEIDFDDVAGNEELIEELQNKIIDPLNNPEKYEEYGLGVENGFLLFGPPGTGKTYTTKALAGELGLSWMPVKGSDITSRYVGAGTENIATIFEEARENQPVLLFLDEIDALAPERGGANQHEDQTKQVNTLLEEISEIHDNDDDVVIVGATNRPDRIDDAMLRSGRLTEKIEVPPPDAKARLGVFAQHLDAPHGQIDAYDVIDASEGMTGADMEKVATEAARNAMERNGKVQTDDVLAAIDNLD